MLTLLCIVLFGIVRAEFEQFYGTWTPVMIFPQEAFILQFCSKYSIFNNSSLPCSCVDGRKTLLITMTLLETKNPLPMAVTSSVFPFSEAGKTEEVMPLLNVSCKCGEEVFSERVVAKHIKDGYYVMYEFQQNATYYTETECNTAYVMARNIDTDYGINEVVEKHYDLYPRKGQVMCSKEIL